MSIKNIGRNKWRVVVKIGVDSDGKNRYLDRVINGTKQDAIDFEATHTLNKGVSSPMTLAAYLNDVWLPTLELEDNTIAYYKAGAKDIVASIGYLRLKELNVYHLEKFLRELPDGSVRKRAKKTLSPALKKAKKWQMLISNPMLDVDVPIGEGMKYDVEAYTVDEVNAILDFYFGNPLEPIIICIAYGGLRKEEALALDWQDINFETGIVPITKAWTLVDSKPIMKGVKTHRQRNVKIDGWAISRLATLGMDRIGPIAVINRKRPDPHYLTQRFAHHMKMLGLRYIPVSNLRHTHATITLQAGVDIAVVSKRLGHAKVSTTADFYIKPLRAAQDAAGGTFADAVGRSEKKLLGDFGDDATKPQVSA